MKEVELKEKRGRKVKQYLHKDGTVTAKIFCDDIHFMKNGVYEEIDNTLVKEKNYYVNKDNDYKAYFYKKTKDSLMRIEKDKHFLNIKLDNCNDVEIDINKNKSKLRSSVIYKNILDNIDFKYDISPNKVKETIILNNKNNLLEKIVFILESDLELVLDDKELLAKDKDEIIFKFEVPFMFDSNSLVNDNISYILIKKENIYELELILDNEWLKSDITYPIYIDPTITNFSNGGTVYDTYISSNEANVNKGNEDILKCGVERIDGVDVIHRTLLKFDLPPISTGDEIIDASLRLFGYMSENEYPGGDYVAIHRVTSDWSEVGSNSATWANMNDKYDSRVESLYDACRSVIGLDGNISFGSCTMYGDITDLVKKWYVDMPNNGIMLKAAKEVYKDENYPAFYSKNNTLAGVENIQPTLEITYRNQNGLESYLNYIKQPFMIGSTNVNTYNGNIVGIWTLGSTIGRKLPANINLVYNTNDVVSGKNTIFGKGYKLNFDQEIVPYILDEEECLKYTDDDGTIHYFFKKYQYDENMELQPVGTSYYDEDGLNLVIDVNDVGYILNDKNGNKMTFVVNSGIGYLSEIEDVSSNKIIISRDENNNIVKIVDADNSEINIIYENNLIKIIGPHSTTELNYENDLLKSITSIEGITSFSYNTNNVITSVIDVTGIKVNYDYYDKIPYRVKEITQYGLNDNIGKNFTFNYEFNATTITDNFGKNNTLIFNSNGNLISKNNLSSNNDITNAYAITQNYGDTFFEKNKLVKKIVPIRYVKNYLNNTSFENEIDNFNITSSLLRSYDMENVRTGNKSLKVISNDVNQYLEKIIIVEKGNSYTFSGYFKNDKDVIISLSYLDSNNNLVEEKQNKSISNDFVREDVTIYYAENATSDLYLKIYLDAESTTYIDDIQLEVGMVANNYNMIENSDFSSGLSDWTLSASVAEPAGSNVIYDPNDYFSVVKVNNNKNNALRVKMEPHNHTSFRKTFPVNGKAGDLFHLSFWYKNEGIYLNSEVSGINVYLMVNPTDESIATEGMQNAILPINLNYWQYFSRTFVAEYDYEGLDVVFNQSRNANDFYITNLSLYKDIPNNTFLYDENGNLVSIKNKSGSFDDYSYDANNQLILSVKNSNNGTNYEYDNVIKNRLLSSISPMGISNKLKYDAFGNIIETKILKTTDKTSCQGYHKIRCKGTNKFLRIENSNKISVKGNSCSNPIWNLVKVDDDYKINYVGLVDYYLSYNEDRLFLTKTSSYDNLFTFEKKENGSYNVKAKEINKYLRVIDNDVMLSNLIENDPSFEFYFEVIDEYFMETKINYDSNGRFIVSTIDANSKKTLYNYDENTGLCLSTTDANNNDLHFTYNTKNQLVAVTQNDKQVTFEYDPITNLLLKITLGDRIFNFEYDDFLNLKSTKIGDNMLLASKQYECNNGSLNSITYGNNDILTFEYDEFNRIKKFYNTNKCYNYFYDNNSNLAKIISDDYFLKMKYDFARRIIEYVFNTFKINYKYDENSNVVNKEYVFEDIKHNITNEFTNNIILSKLFIDNNEIMYNYDSLGRLNSININDILITSYTYVNNGKKTSNLIKSIKNGNNEYSYKYDNLNNITHIYYNDLLIKQYDYDCYNQLISEKNYDLNIQINYSYDLYGNIQNKTIIDLTTTNIIDSNVYEYNDSQWCDKLTSFDNNYISYDEIGNPLTFGENVSMNWVDGKYLDSYSDSSLNLSVNYKYDANGMRISKTINNVETKYFLDGKDVVYEKRGDTLLYYLYDLSGIIGILYNDNVYFYVKNVQGDIIGMIDNLGNRVVTYEYDSWGNILTIKDNEGTNITDTAHIGHVNPFRYRGYYFDSETKLYYLGKRYYNPKWGRFVSPDSLIVRNSNLLSLNLYQYAYNNPINFEDGSGQWPKFIKDIGKGIKKIGDNIKKVGKAAEKQAKKFVNNTTRLGWGIVTGALDYLGCGVSSDMLNHSLQDKPKDIKYTDKDEIVKKIKNDTAFKKKVDEAVSNSKNGKVYLDNSLAFSSFDMVGSIHNADILIEGDLGDDNCGTLHVTIEDTYDFDYEDEYYGDGFKGIILAFGNNLAWLDTKLGGVEEYKVMITFDYEYCGE